MDVGSPLGTPIGFPTEGRVVDIKQNDEKTPFKPGHRNQVVVQIQDSDYAFSVSHNSAILVTEGQNIQHGQAISLSGNTGRTSGNSDGGYHTYVEIYKKDGKDWKPIQPNEKESPTSSTPVAKKVEEKKPPRNHRVYEKELL